MKAKDLIIELLNENLDEEIYFRFEDDGGNEHYFRCDGLTSMHQYKTSYYGSKPTVILESV